MTQFTTPSKYKAGPLKSTPIAPRLPGPTRYTVTSLVLYDDSDYISTSSLGECCDSRTPRLLPRVKTWVYEANRWSTSSRKIFHRKSTWTVFSSLPKVSNRLALHPDPSLTVVSEDESSVCKVQEDGLPCREAQLPRQGKSCIST